MLLSIDRILRTVTLAGAVFLPMVVDAATVYTETNRVAGNEIQIYRSGADGSLALTGSVATGGRGTDAGLGSQGAIALSGNGRWLFAVNAGSNEISAFAVTPRGLTLVDKVDSDGERPISLTVHHDVLYVLNAGGSGNIAGFNVLDNGRIRAIPGSTRPLGSAASAPAQIAFDRDGETLVVSEKATNSFSIYGVDDDLPVGPTVVPSVGKTPFGFEFDRHDNVLVSEAFGGAANASALSSYDLDKFPLSLEAISASIPTRQTAACWVVLARHSRYAYVTNTGSGTITGYRVHRSGTLTPLNADGVTGVTGGNPIDATTARDDRTVYVLTPSIGKIVAFRVRDDGRVVQAGSADGVPGTAVGLAAR
jgi:6-phosphogluconolactonase